MSQLEDNKSPTKKNLALDDRDILFRCLNGDFNIKVHIAVNSATIKSYIEQHDDNGETTPLVFDFPDTKENVLAAFRSCMLPIKEYLMLGNGSLSQADICKMNYADFTKFISSAIIKVNEIPNIYGDKSYTASIILNGVSAYFIGFTFGNNYRYREIITNTKGCVLIEDKNMENAEDISAAFRSRLSWMDHYEHSELLIMFIPGYTREKK